MEDEGDSMLRQQFQILQEQQQKKLLRMKQLKEEKAAKKDASSKPGKGGAADSNENKVNGFGVDDDLGLKVRS